MKNFFISLLIILSLSSSSYLYAEENIIKEISVEGTQRIDIETVISYSDISKGTAYTDELGNQVLKKLFDTNLFSNIKVSFFKNTLNIEINENPTINFVSFEGNSKVKDEDLMLEISLKERTVYSRSKVLS